MATFSSLQTSLLFLFPFIIIMIFIIHNKWISFYSKTKKNLPSSPKKLPIIGNFHQLAVSNPNQTLHALSQKHGAMMLLHLGSIPTIVASSAEAAKEIMKTHDLSFCSRPNSTMANILMYGCNDIGFAPYGEDWRRLKSIAVIHLLSNTRVKSYKKVREEELGVLISMLMESCGTTVDIGALFASFTNNIISRVALGRTFNGSKHTELIRRLLDTVSSVSVGDYIPWLKWVDRVTGLVRRAERIAKEFDEFLEGVIEEHVNKTKKKKKKSVISDEEQDFIDILLDVQKDNTTLHRDSIKGVILDVFLAGTDTTYTTLEWALSELIRNPKVMRKLQQEVRSTAQERSLVLEEDLEKMWYLKAVVKETLRLHPPIPFLLPRKSMKDVKLMGYDIARCTQVMINVWAIGRDPTFWEESTEFRPERFLNNSINQGFHFEWLPFGAGRRSCPGGQFGVVVIEFALANIINKFDIEFPKGMTNKDLDMSEAYGITIHKKFPLLVTMSRRF